MSQKLLSIAIPTWNRAEILKNSLSRLLPQILECKEDIQFIISDNASDDNTIEIIKTLLNQYPDIESTVFRQSENTGYYGNFKKCRELATGKYFWLLSDNEVIANGVLKLIIENLIHETGIGIVYLNNDPRQYEFVAFKTSFDQLFKIRNYRLTFISACILLNRKDSDKDIFVDFYDNSFLGFVLLLSVRKHTNQAIEICGSVYESLPAVVSFNIFSCWTKDIFQCFSYIAKENLFEKDAVEGMKENILEFVLKDHMTSYKLHGSYYGKNLGTFIENYNLLNQYYVHNQAFSKIVKIKYTPNFILFTKIYLRKSLRKLKKIFTSNASNNETRFDRRS